MPRPSYALRKRTRAALEEALAPFLFDDTRPLVEVGRAMQDAQLVARLIATAESYLEATTDPRTRRDIDPPRYQVRARRVTLDGLDGAPARDEIRYDVIDTDEGDEVLDSYDTLEAADARAYGELVKGA